MLGDIVNVVANYTKQAVGESGGPDAPSKSFVEEIKGPAVHLVKIYVAQGICTFGYIFSLSCVGEDDFQVP